MQLQPELVPNSYMYMYYIKQVMCAHTTDSHALSVLYSETCSCDHLYSETTSIQRPLGRVPIVALPCIFTSIKRPPLFKDHFFWPKRGRLIQVSLYMVPQGPNTRSQYPDTSTWPYSQAQHCYGYIPQQA